MFFSDRTITTNPPAKLAVYRAMLLGVHPWPEVQPPRGTQELGGAGRNGAHLGDAYGADATGIARDDMIIKARD